MGAATEFFRIYYSEDNDYYKNFISQDITGTGYDLNRVFRKLSVHYYQMISEIENGICRAPKKGDNIPNYIREKISNATVVLAMVSKEYKKSEVCMNEVGAAWAFENEPISIVLPDADFTELGWLINLDKAVKIDNPDALNHLQKILCEKLGFSIKIPLHWNP